MRYGNDYGIKVEIPWYIRCPIINRLFKTCRIKVTLTTFSMDGGPMIGVSGDFRIPIEDRKYDITSLIRIRFCFPRHSEMQSMGHGLYSRIEVLDINRRKVVEARRGKEGEPFMIGSFVRDKKSIAYQMGMWHEETIDLKIGNSDFKEAK